MTKTPTVLITKVNSDVVETLRNEYSLYTGSKSFNRISYKKKQKLTSDDYRQKHLITLDVFERFKGDVFEERFGNLLATELDNNSMNKVALYLDENYEDWKIDNLSWEWFLEKDKNLFYLLLKKKSAKIKKTFYKAFRELTGDEEVRIHIDKNNSKFMPRIFVYMQKSARRIQMISMTFESSKVENGVILKTSNRILSPLKKKDFDYEFFNNEYSSTLKKGEYWGYFVNGKGGGKSSINNLSTEKNPFSIQNVLYSINQSLSTVVNENDFFEVWNLNPFSQPELDSRDPFFKFQKEKGAKYCLELNDRYSNTQVDISMDDKVKKMSPDNLAQMIKSMGYVITNNSENKLIIQSDETKDKVEGQHVTIRTPEEFFRVDDEGNVKGLANNLCQSLNEFKKRRYEIESIDSLGVESITYSGTIASVFGQKEWDRSNLAAMESVTDKDFFVFEYIVSEDKVYTVKESNGVSSLTIKFSNGIKIMSSTNYLSIFLRDKDSQGSTTKELNNYLKTGGYSLTKGKRKKEYNLEMIMPLKHPCGTTPKSRLEKQKRIKRYIVSNTKKLSEEELNEFVLSFIENQVYYPKEFSLETSTSNTPFLFLIKSKIEQKYRNRIKSETETNSTSA